ncbi:helix-turn-helix transcriptional regulator [Crocinitomix catalasitica]|uniref:helix-turn-helix transcriptional regulator n=1 Tax=Crocinitomix catalasitica TaxID=184607 RepID=UPI00056B5429|nr:YafY family protein [Crocinitomix catalasitica]
MEKPRLIRLTAILTLLQSKNLVTAREIAEKHDISIRTVYRDIRTLEQSGIPIVTEEGKGYALLEGYNLPPVMFTEQEANALITAQLLVDNNKDDSLIAKYSDAVNKIKSVLNYSLKDRVEFLSERMEIRTYENTANQSNYLIQIQSAITNYTCVDLLYNSLENKVTKRIVEPFALIQTKDQWVMIAHCQLRNDFRAFRLDRMQELIILNVKFRPHELSLKEYYQKYF